MKLISTVVVREERNEGMNGMNSPVTSHNWRIFMCGNKGLLMTQSCRTESTSERGRYRMAHSSSFRILWAYFRKRAHSNVLGNLSKDFQTEQSRKGERGAVSALTVHSPSFQTSSGNDLSNGSSRFWVSHNTSNTGSSKFFRQHTSATAAALAFDSASSHAISLMISSTLRQACIYPRRCA